MYLTQRLLLLLHLDDFTGIRLSVALLRHFSTWLLRWQRLLRKRLQPWL